MGDRWERTDCDTCLPDDSRTVQRHASHRKDLIKQLSGPRTPVDGLDNEGKRYVWNQCRNTQIVRL